MKVIRQSLRYFSNALVVKTSKSFYKNITRWNKQKTDYYTTYFYALVLYYSSQKPRPRNFFLFLFLWFGFIRTLGCFRRRSFFPLCSLYLLWNSCLCVTHVTVQSFDKISSAEAGFEEANKYFDDGIDMVSWGSDDSELE